jgi:hypothetical protein
MQSKDTAARDFTEDSRRGPGTSASHTTAIQVYLPGSARNQRLALSTSGVTRYSRIYGSYFLSALLADPVSDQA